MSSNTTNYGLVKPGVNDPTDQDLWGTELNNDMDGIDGLTKTAMGWAPSNKTATFSVTAPTSGSTTTGDSRKLFLCDATSGAITANLPAASGNSGLVIAVKKTDSSSNAVTIDGNSSETIDGATTYSITSQNVCVILECDGSNWRILSDTTINTPVADLRVMSNISGGSAAPSANTLTAIIDAIIGNTQGAILYRNSTIWTKLDPGTSGYFLKTQGAAANPTWDSVSSSVFTAQSVVTGSRAFSTNYRNTSGKTMFVSASSDGGAQLTAKTDSNTTPTTVVAESISGYNSKHGQITFMVLNNNYYRVESESGSVSVWTEWT